MPFVHVNPKPSVAAQGCPSCRQPELWFPKRNYQEVLARTPGRCRTEEIAGEHMLRKNLIEVGLPERQRVAWDSDDEYLDEYSVLAGRN